MTGGSSGESGVGRVALAVNDLDSVAEFYRDVVGLDVLEKGVAHASLGVDEAVLELLHDPDAPPRGMQEAGLFHTAFRVPNRASLADALRRVEEWGLDGASDHLVSEALYLQDPEGNGVEIYRDRPRGEWPVEDGGVRMPSLPLDLDDVREEARGREDAPEGTDVGHVHLETTSLPAAVEFYHDGLGLNVRHRYGDTAVFLAVGEYHHHVGLNTWNRRSRASSGRGLAWFGLRLDRSPEEVVGALEDTRIETELLRGGARVVGPDGVEVRLLQD